MQAQFFDALKGGGVPLFNPLFAFLFFYVFQRTNNVHAYLGLREGQSYETVLPRKLPNPNGSLSDEFAINEHTTKLLHLFVASCLDAGVNERRQKVDLYRAHVATLKALNSEAGGRNWRKELAECLSKWHPVFRGTVKHRKGSRLGDDLPQVYDMQVVASFL